MEPTRYLKDITHLGINKYHTPSYHRINNSNDIYDYLYGNVGVSGKHSLPFHQAVNSIDNAGEKMYKRHFNYGNILRFDKRYNLDDRILDYASDRLMTEWKIIDNKFQKAQQAYESGNITENKFNRISKKYERNAKRYNGYVNNLNNNATHFNIANLINDGRSVVTGKGPLYDSMTKGIWGLIFGGIGAGFAPVTLPKVATVGWKFLSHPIVQTIGTIDGIRNLVTDNGINKTINHFKNEEYGKGSLSLLGDVLDASPLIGIYKTYKSAYNGLRTGQDVITPKINRIKNYVLKPFAKKVYNIQDLENAILNNRNIDTSNLLKLIKESSVDDLHHLKHISKYKDNEMALIPAVIDAVHGPGDDFVSHLESGMHAMRNGDIPDSKWIRDATNTIKSVNFKGEPRIPYEILHKIIPANKYISHGIPANKLRNSIKKWDSQSVMPSLAIYPENQAHQFYGDIVFLGDKNLLNKSILYVDDAYTPTVSRIQNINENSIDNVFNKMKLEKPSWWNTKTLSIDDLDHINYTQRRVLPEVINSNTFTKYFFNRVNTRHIKGGPMYMEAKYQEILPFSKFKHVLIPRGMDDLVEWSVSQRIPYTLYDKDENFYSTLTNLLSSNKDLTFKHGGKLCKKQ